VCDEKQSRVLEGYGMGSKLRASAAKAKKIGRKDCRSTDLSK